MDPDRKRQIRLVVALSAAVILAAALIYTSFTAGSSDRQPSELLASTDGIPTRLVGRVVDDSIVRKGSNLRFEVADLEDPSTTVRVDYSGQIPDPFREGREVLVEGELTDGVFEGKHDSLITKCPSKFAAAAEEDPDHVIIED